MAIGYWRFACDDVSIVSLLDAKGAALRLWRSSQVQKIHAMGPIGPVPSCTIYRKTHGCKTHCKDQSATNAGGLSHKNLDCGPWHIETWQILNFKQFGEFRIQGENL